AGPTSPMMRGDHRMRIRLVSAAGFLSVLLAALAPAADVKNAEERPQGDRPKAAEETPTTRSVGDGKFDFTIDTSDTPDLKDWADNELRPVVREWYPKIVKMLPSDGFTAPDHFII